MQPKNLKIFDSTNAADVKWIDISNLVLFSVQLTGVEAATWIEVSNDQYVNIDGFGASGAALVATPSAPVLTQAPAAFGGLVGQGTYYVKITYVTPWGETLASTESSLAVSDGNVLTVVSPAAEVTGLATGYNIYMSKTSGAEVLQTGPAYVPARTVDSTPGLHFAISGAIPLGRNLAFPNGFINSTIPVPGSSTAGGIGVGLNVVPGGDFSTISSDTEQIGPISILVDSNQKQATWAPSGITWKWLRVRKSSATQTAETVAWLEGLNG